MSERDLAQLVFVAAAILIGVGIDASMKVRKKIEGIGAVKCARCGHEGIPKQAGYFFSPKIACGKCDSEQWEPLKSA